MGQDAIRHVLLRLPSELGQPGRVWRDAAERMRRADLDGDLKWSAKELRALVESLMLEAGYTDSVLRDHVLHDTLRGCVAW